MNFDICKKCKIYNSHYMSPSKIIGCDGTVGIYYENDTTTYDVDYSEKLHTGIIDKLIFNESIKESLKRAKVTKNCSCYAEQLMDEYNNEY